MRWPEALFVAAVLLSATEMRSQTLPDARAGYGSDSIPSDTTANAVVPVDTARVPDVTGSNGGQQAADDDCPLGPNRRAAQVGAGAVFLGANVELFRRF